MFYRQNLETSLSGLSTMLKDRTDGSDTLRVSPDSVEFHLDATDPAVKMGEKEVPANEHNLGMLGDFLQIPSGFQKRMAERLSSEVRNEVYTGLLRNTVGTDMAVVVKNSGVGGVFEWGKHEKVNPARVVDAVTPVFGDSDPVITRLVDEVNFFGFDAAVPFDADDEKGRAFGVGGDFEQGDLTASGVRIGMNLKQGLSPEVAPYNFRRFCTNGMEAPMVGLKIDSRGQTVEEVMAELEAMARLAFAQAEKDIEHFYSLREERVDNPERAIRRIARERGIPDRSVVAIQDLAAGEDLPDEPTMFDVVNLVTNFANAPQVRNDGGRLLLERAGGAVVSDHASRCGHCLQKVTS